MKKAFLLLAAVACIAVSCKDKEEKGPVLSPDQNKETLDETCTKAVELLEVENWQSTADLITESAAVFNTLEGMDESFGVWVQGITDSFSVSDQQPYEYLYDLTKVNGTITIKDKQLHAEDGTGLSIAYNLADGTAVDGKMTVKNSSTKALVDTDYDYTWDEAGNETKTLWSKTYLIIPAEINATVNAGGKKAAGVKITTDVRLAGEEPKPTDTYSATCEVTADKYTFAVTRAKYSDTEVALSASIKYDKQTVVAATFEAKGKLAFDEDEDLDYAKTTGNVKASFKILDNVEVKGDANWTEIAKNAGTELRTEEDARTIAALLEANTNLTLYVQNTAQAKLGWEAYQPALEAGIDSWSVQAVVRFEDGSQYQLPEEFFSPNNFPKTVEAVNNALAEMQKFLAGPQAEDESLN